MKRREEMPQETMEDAIAAESEFQIRRIAESVIRRITGSKIKTIVRIDQKYKEKFELCIQKTKLVIYKLEARLITARSNIQMISKCNQQETTTITRFKLTKAF